MGSFFYFVTRDFIRLGSREGVFFNNIRSASNIQRLFLGHISITLQLLLPGIFLARVLIDFLSPPKVTAFISKDGFAVLLFNYSLVVFAKVFEYPVSLLPFLNKKPYYYKQDKLVLFYVISVL